MLTEKKLEMEAKKREEFDKASANLRNLRFQIYRSINDKKNRGCKQMKIYEDRVCGFVKRFKNHLSRDEIKIWKSKIRRTKRDAKILDDDSTRDEDENLPKVHEDEDPVDEGSSIDQDLKERLLRLKSFRKTWCKPSKTPDERVACAVESTIGTVLGEPKRNELLKHVSGKNILDEQFSMLAFSEDSTEGVDDVEITDSDSADLFSSGMDKMYEDFKQKVEPSVPDAMMFLQAYFVMFVCFAKSVNKFSHHCSRSPFQGSLFQT